MFRHVWKLFFELSFINKHATNLPENKSPGKQKSEIYFTN